MYMYIYIYHPSSYLSMDFLQSAIFMLPGLVNIQKHVGFPMPSSGE